MKGFTIGQKAKAYDEAIERAKNFIENGDERERTIAESIFAGIMEESEDERIRKAILTGLIDCRDASDLGWSNFGGINIDKCIDWLEKQGEHVNKVDTNFKVGKWYVDKQDGTILQITKVLRSTYKYITNTGEEHYCAHCCLEQDMHLWTIQDAKKGDVLSDGTTIFIFKDLLSDGSVMSYCDYDTDSGESDAFCPLSMNLMCSKITPATKGQRGTLEKAMADAGYTFDFENKLLKKIVVPIFNIGDTIAKKHNSDIHDFGSFTITDITGGKYWCNDRIICDISEQNEWEIYEPVRQNPTEWSEEDEIMFECALNMIEWYSVVDKDLSRRVSDWLKTLKDRIQPKQEWSEEDEKMYASIIDDTVQENQLDGKQIDWLRNIKYRNFARPQNTWKPSEEQMKALEQLEEMHVLGCKKTQENARLYVTIKSLKEQLKQL